MCQRNEHFPYVSSPAKGNFVLEFHDGRQVWLPRMRQRDACWAGELSLRSSHLVNAPSRYLYIDLWYRPTQMKRGIEANSYIAVLTGIVQIYQVLVMLSIVLCVKFIK